MTRIAAEFVDAYVIRPAGDGWEVLQLHRAPSVWLGGTWQAVHGHIEAGETAAAAALREVAEETHLAVGELFQVEHVNTFYVADHDAVQMCPGFACLVAAAAEPTLNAEHDAARWLALPAGIDRFLWPGQREALRQICRDILTASPIRDILRIKN